MQPPESTSSHYELLDCGAGRKLERFGSYILDRPSPPAECSQVRNRSLWNQADARYERRGGEAGTWESRVALPREWSAVVSGMHFCIKPTPFGHVGLFAEQELNWTWLRGVIEASTRPLKFLNLFAYTGGSTMAAALAGAEVVHIDAAKNVVQWARRNAKDSGLESAPIRWIDEDAMRFVNREVKRGNHYDGIILDPPTYGHGPKGEQWKIDDHLPQLLAGCAQLLQGDSQHLLLSCHSPSHDADVLRSLVLDIFDFVDDRSLEVVPLSIEDSFGKSLPAGCALRIAPPC